MTEDVAVEGNADDELEAGFNEARGIEQDAPPEPPASEPEVAAEAPEPEAVQEEPEDAIVPGLDMPASQVKALLASAAKTEAEFSKIYGKFGDVQRNLNQYKELQEEITRLKDEGNKAGSVALSAKADKLLSRVKAEYPELGDLLAQDLSELSGGEAPDVKSAVEPLNQQVNALKEQIEVLRLERVHPDWQDVAKSHDFAIWKAGLKPEIRERLDSSYDANFIAKGLTAYKEWKGASTKAEQGKTRLERAITPSGTPSSSIPAKTPEQIFEEAFKNARHQT